MKPFKVFCTLGFLLCIANVFTATNAQTTQAGHRSGFGQVLASEIDGLENQLVRLAEAMPEDKFDFSPAGLRIPGNKFEGVRTFAQQVRHVAADNYALWLAAAGKPEPPGVQSPNGPAEMKTRSEIIKFLKDSFVAARQASNTLTAENELDLVDFRGGKMTRLALIFLALNHGNDHYGQMVVYLRMCGVDPQTALRAPAAKR